MSNKVHFTNRKEVMKWIDYKMKQIKRATKKLRKQVKK